MEHGMKRLLVTFGLAVLAAAPAAQAGGGHFSGGVEGYWDRYQEPDHAIRVDNRAEYGGLTGTYSYAAGPVNLAVDARVDIGTNHYHSVDGSDSGEPQYETEERVRIGTTIPLGRGMALLPYTGAGMRLYYDNGKGYFTNLGYAGYDRRIAQFYVPVGAKFAFSVGDWDITPSLEYDRLLLGKVDTRTQSLGSSNLVFTQHDGYGLRGEVMFGHGRWEFGPFARYWNIKQSNVKYDYLGVGYIEPDNTRLQLGADLRYHF
jgi:hypothetical protein